MHKSDFDVIIVGAGPGGCVCAISLANIGVTSLIIEKDPFPRYHVGESLTGEAGMRLRDLGLETVMNEHKFPVKRGVTVYGKNGENSFVVPTQSRSADGKLVDATTWQVDRQAFDNLLLEHAKSLGVEFLQGEVLSPLLSGNKVKGVCLQLPGEQKVNLHSKVVVDASGSQLFMARKSSLTSPVIRGDYDRQVAVFTQLKGAKRDPGDAKDNTLIFYEKSNHWAWFIPISEEIVSVGVVTPGEYLKKHGRDRTKFLKRELASLNSELTNRVADTTFEIPVQTVSNYSYRIKEFTGPGFLSIGDSHRFIDPIFSFGVHFAIHEGIMAADAIQKTFQFQNGDQTEYFKQFQAISERGQDIIQDMLDFFWGNPLVFLFYVHYKYRDEFIDLFAGRIYAEEAEQREGLVAMRKFLRKQSAAKPTREQKSLQERVTQIDDIETR